MNACHWLLNPVPDQTAPAMTSSPAVTSSDCSAVIAWTTDEAATSVVDYGPTAGYGSSANTQGYVQNHSVLLTPLVPGTPYHFRVGSADNAGNGPTQSDDATFTTAAAAAPLITASPSATAITGTSAVIAWATDEAASSAVDYGETIAYGSTASGPSLVTEHQVTLSGLTPQTSYHYRAKSSDACGAGPTASADAMFTTGPASIDVSGWTLKHYSATLTYVIPPGTTIPSGGYVVVGRNGTRAEFLSAFPSMPAATVYLNSNADGSRSTAGCFPQINGDESFELYNASSTLLDGPTIPMSTTHRAYRRVNPGDPPGASGSWNVVAESLANPGQGAGAGSLAGVRINEMSDAADYTKEFVELYYDASPAAPDLTAPGAVVDLAAEPQSSSSVRLTWTATGDDGSVGTADSYNLRRRSQRILTDADFAAATPIGGALSPKAAGKAESLVVSALVADTAYYFALKVADEAAQTSPLSNVASAVTGPAGGGSTVNHLVISQIRIAAATDDVVELYNPTSAPISLTDTSVQYLAANGNFGFRVNLTGANSVPKHGWYLVAANGYSGSPSRDDSMGTSNMSPTAGHALLVSKTTNVSGCSDAAIIRQGRLRRLGNLPRGRRRPRRDDAGGRAVGHPQAGRLDGERPGHRRQRCRLSGPRDRRVSQPLFHPCNAPRGPRKREEHPVPDEGPRGDRAGLGQRAGGNLRFHGGKPSAVEHAVGQLHDRRRDSDHGLFLSGARYRRHRRVAGVDCAQNSEANQVAESVEHAAQKSFFRTAACLPEIFAFMDRFFAQAGIGDAHRMPMHFVVEEWFTNLVKYSRGGTEDILLDLKRHGSRLVLSLTDFGVERFDIRDVPDVDVHRDLKDRTPGGLGIHLLKRMVDNIEYEFVDGRSTTTFVKELE